MNNNYYIKGKNAFRGVGDTKRWLRVRSIEKDGNRVAVSFFLAGEEKFMSLTYGSQPYVEFGKGKWPKVEPIEWHTILEEEGYVQSEGGEV
jgi:hypothetical protein